VKPRVQHIAVPGLSEAIAARGVPLSVATRARGFVFVSGLPPIDPATGAMVNQGLQAQLHRAIDNLGLALHAAGASFDDLVMVTLYVTNAGFFGEINRIYRERFGHLPPARTCISIGSWPFEADVEIEAIAVCDDASVPVPRPTPNP
jgi:2-iminobutanoate/2-iminopropanoate deaminase